MGRLPADRRLRLHLQRVAWLRARLVVEDVQENSREFQEYTRMLINFRDTEGRFFPRPR